MLVLSSHAIRVSGELDGSFEAQLIGALGILERRDDAEIDLTECRAISPRAVVDILAFQRRRAADNATVRIVGIAPEILQAFEALTGGDLIRAIDRLPEPPRWQIDPPPYSQDEKPKLGQLPNKAASPRWIRRPDWPNTPS